jgi:hypothetical protein
LCGRMDLLCKTKRQSISTLPVTQETLWRTRSDMNGMAECLQCRLVKPFAQGWMRMDSARHILQPGAHLDRQAEAGCQLRDAGAHALDSQ